MTWLRGPGESSSEGRVIEEAALSRAGACAYSALCYHNWTHCPIQSAQDTGLSGQVLCISRELGTRCGSTHLWSWHIESRRFLQASLGYIVSNRKKKKKKERGSTKINNQVTGRVSDEENQNSDIPIPSSAVSTQTWMISGWNTNRHKVKWLNEFCTWHTSVGGRECLRWFWI